VSSGTKKKRCKGKGGQFEREIAKQLSLWWTAGERDDIFWRSDSSGARATSRTKLGKTTANSQGDIKYLDEDGRSFIDTFLVEIKRGYSKDLAILPLLDRPEGKHKLYEFWEQAETDRATTTRPYSILIFKRDRMNCCAMITTKLFMKIERWRGTYEQEHIHIHCKEKETFVVLNFKFFLEWLSPEVVRRWTNKQ